MVGIPGTAPGTGQRLAAWAWAWVAVAVSVLDTIAVTAALVIATEASIDLPIAETGTWINLVAGPAFPLLAALMLRNRGRNPDRPPHQDRLAWLFLGFGALCAATCVLHVFVMYGLRHDGPVVLAGAWVYTWLWIGVPTGLLLALLWFPTGDVPGPRWRWAVGGVAVSLAAIWLAIAFSPGEMPAFSVHIANPEGWTGAGPALRVIGFAGFLTLAVTAVATLASVGWRFYRGDAAVRAQLRWLLAAVGVIAVTIAVPGPKALGIVIVALNVIATFLLPVTLAVTLVRRDGLILPRLLVYGLLSALLLAAYIAVVGLALAVLGSRTDRAAIFVAAGLIIRLISAAGQMPRRLIRVLQRGADHPVQPAPGRAGQHGLGCFPQQRVAEPQHRIRRHRLQHPRLRRLIHQPAGRAARHRAQQPPRGRACQRRRLHHRQRRRAEPVQPGAQRPGQRGRQVHRRAVMPAARHRLPGQLQRRVRAPRGQRHHLPQHPRRPPPPEPGQDQLRQRAVIQPAQVDPRHARSELVVQHPGQAPAGMPGAP